MKILIAIHTFFGNGRAGGTETWATTMQAELERTGHTVEITDSTSRSCVSTITGAPIDTPDMALVAHNTCLAQLKHIDCTKILTCHGVLPQLEQPRRGADIYVAVSEEVQAHMHQRGYEATVIRNPIDCERFKPDDRELPRVPGGVWFYSRYVGDAGETCAQAFAPICYTYRAPGHGGHVGQLAVPDVMNDQDLVIAIGRSAYEAAACGRNLIVGDYNGFDGFATPESMLEFRKNNCSGRRYGIHYTPEELRQIAERNYDPAMGARLREYILENNDVRKIARQYLELI